ncbi:MAG: hypothetical protein AMXMBFR4_14340 [Candidatus Hydrogenedentota bacterium]
MRNAFRKYVAIGAFCVASLVAMGSTIDGLVADLKSSDVKLRVRARQLLPREGVSAIEKLMPILASDDLSLRGTAFNVIADIANAAAAPGRDADRRRAAELLMTLVAPEQPEAVKIQGLRLLPIVVSEGFDISPVANLLKQDDLREKARAALIEIGAGEACVALLSALEGADAPFTVALLNAIETFEEESSLERVVEFTSHKDPAVRAAAVRAIAWSGKPDFVALMEKAAQTSTPETQPTVFDAWLRLADAMAAKGGNWDAAIAQYQAVLRYPVSMAIRSAAIMGLGRHGDGSVAGHIVAAGQAFPGEHDTVVAMALTSLQGKEGVTAALAEYPELSVIAKQSMLEIWGQRKETLAIDLMKQELEHATPEIRMAALHALASVGSMEAFAPLVKVARSGNDEERAFAFDAAKRMAGSLDTAGNKEGAGLAYLQLWELTEEESVRLDVLRGLARCPVPQAFELVKSALGQPALNDAAIEALAGVTAALGNAHQAEQTKEALALLQSTGASAETLVRLASSIQGAGLPEEFSNLLGVVRKWKVIGPFDWKDDSAWTMAFVGEPDVDPDTAVTYGERELEWKPVRASGAIGTVDLIGALGPVERSFGYAYAEVDVAEETDAQIRLGSDDGNQVWLNGIRVYENRVDRGAALDQDKVDVHLKKGINTILVKVSQGAGGWNFCLRLASADGTGIAFTQPG